MLRFAFVFVFAGWRLALPSALAQSAATGVITGRIYNPNTGEFLRNAEIRVETGETAVAGGGGEFRLDGVPAGRATLVVTYTGYRSATANVTVEPGSTVTQDFNLVSAIDTAGAGSETIKLGQFVVSTDREGSDIRAQGHVLK